VRPPAQVLPACRPLRSDWLGWSGCARATRPRGTLPLPPPGIGLALQHHRQPLTLERLALQKCCGLILNSRCLHGLWGAGRCVANWASCWDGGGPTCSARGWALGCSYRPRLPALLVHLGNSGDEWGRRKVCGREGAARVCGASQGPALLAAFYSRRATVCTSSPGPARQPPDVAAPPASPCRSPQALARASRRALARLAPPPRLLLSSSSHVVQPGRGAFDPGARAGCLLAASCLHAAAAVCCTTWCPASAPAGPGSCLRAARPWPRLHRPPNGHRLMGTASLPPAAGLRGPAASAGGAA
jgi:hypothetical protein